MRKTILQILLLLFVFFAIYFTFTVLYHKSNKQQPPKQEANQTYVQDSLCQVWVDSTHLRVAFKTWYKKNKGKTHE